MQGGNILKPKHVKKLFEVAINQVTGNHKNYCINPKTNFKRNKKLSFETMVKAIFGMGSGNLTNEILNFFNCSPDAATASAFVQQRSKIKAEAFKDIFKIFSESISSGYSDTMRILAVDGSDLQISSNPKDILSHFSGTNGQKSYNILHLNALYDLKNNIYVDATIEKAKEFNEHKALVSMINSSNIKNAIVIADRGYESYNNIAHIQEKGWKYLIRIKDKNVGIKSGLDLPQLPCFDVKISLNLTRKNNKELLKKRNEYKYISPSTKFDFLPQKTDKSQPTVFYKLNFRIVRFKISENTFETIITNLDEKEYPPERLKKLYAMRWGIETSFRDLKYTVGMIYFHSKKVMCIQQEIYAHLAMYNFAKSITSGITVKNKPRKHTYKANFTVAMYMCRLFYLGKTTSPVLEVIISNNINPVRPNRHSKRGTIKKTFRDFLYRIT